MTDINDISKRVRATLEFRDESDIVFYRNFTANPGRSLRYQLFFKRPFFQYGARVDRKWKRVFLTQIRCAPNTACVSGKSNGYN